MASSISDDHYQIVNKPGDGPMGNYTQSIKCVLCLKVVAYIRDDAQRPGPALCLRCHKTREDNEKLFAEGPKVSSPDTDK